MFTVKSAYNLAFQEQMASQGVGATSGRPGGDRPLWKLIRQCLVPPKVWTLAWRIGRNALATQSNKVRRGIETPLTCLICGLEEETTFHVFMRCPHARRLWEALGQDWQLPDHGSIQNNGTEWLLHLLPGLSLTQRAQVLMILWRIWHAHNEVTHQKPLQPIEGSRRFLLSYLESLTVLKQHPNADLEKGKMVVDPELGLSRAQKREDCRPKVRKKWKAPPGELTKLNVRG
jgi:hypothetical protein